MTLDILAWNYNKKENEMEFEITKEDLSHLGQGVIQKHIGDKVPCLYGRDVIVLTKDDIMALITGGVLSIGVAGNEYQVLIVFDKTIEGE